MSGLVIFVLDTNLGIPAANVKVELRRRNDSGSWQCVTQGLTDSQGCIDDFYPSSSLVLKDQYQLSYHTTAYFYQQGLDTIYPKITVQFIATDTERLVLPLLISANGYSTYRGS